MLQKFTTLHPGWRPWSNMTIMFDHGMIMAGSCHGNNVFPTRACTVKAVHCQKTKLGYIIGRVTRFFCEKFKKLLSNSASIRLEEKRQIFVPSKEPFKNSIDKINNRHNLNKWNSIIKRTVAVKRAQKWLICQNFWQRDHVIWMERSFERRNLHELQFFGNLKISECKKQNLKYNHTVTFYKQLLMTTFLEEIQQVVLQKYDFECWENPIQLHFLAFRELNFREGKKWLLTEYFPFKLKLPWKIEMTGSQKIRNTSLIYKTLAFDLTQNCGEHLKLAVHS